MIDHSPQPNWKSVREILNEERIRFENAGVFEGFCYGVLFSCIVILALLS